jgi:hypothetical protein
VGHRLHTCFHLTEDTTGHPLIDVLEVYFLELPSLREAVLSGKTEDPTKRSFLTVYQEVAATSCISCWSPLIYM